MSTGRDEDVEDTKHEGDVEAPNNTNRRGMSVRFNSRAQLDISATTESLDGPGVDEAPEVEEMRGSEEMLKYARLRDAEVRRGLFRSTLEACDMPSLFIVVAVNHDAKFLDMVGPTSLYTVRLLALLVAFIQVVFPVWFIGNCLSRRSPLLLAPGFHPRRGPGEDIRVVQFHNFVVDFMASCFLLYLSWSAWQRRTLDAFRVFLLTKHPGLYKRWMLYFGFFGQILTILSVVIMTYILFRLSPAPTDILLNSVALEFLINFDVSIVEAFYRQPHLRTFLVATKKRLAEDADDLIAHRGLDALMELKLASWRNLLGVCADADDLAHSARFQLAREPRLLELTLRGFREIYYFVCFGLYLLAFTGGHICHSHIKSLFWFVGFMKQRPVAETSYPPLSWLVGGQSSNKHKDSIYAPIAFVGIVSTYAVVSLFIRRITRADRVREEERRKHHVYLRKRRLSSASSSPALHGLGNIAAQLDSVDSFDEGIELGLAPDGPAASSSLPGAANPTSLSKAE